MQSVTAEQEIRIEGIPLSGGVAYARAYLLESSRQDMIVSYSIHHEMSNAEQNRLHRAIAEAETQLDKLVADVTERLGSTQANIFLAQKMMLKDPVLLEQMLQGIQNDLLNAEAIVDQILRGYEAQLFAIDNEFMKERVSDISEIRLRLLNSLQRQNGDSHKKTVEGLFQPDELRIIIASELLPSETISLDTNVTLGFICEKVGQASHAAILARALGIPAISGVQGLTNDFLHGEPLLIDGASGTIFRRPCQNTLNLYPSVRKASKKKVHHIEPVCGFKVLANISLATECDQINEVNAEGVGLYRTEFEFFYKGNPLTEDEQYDRYSTVVNAMQGRTLHIRLLDFGGDKPAPFLELAQEQNPFLGFRGARLLQKRADLLIPQARALARASVHGPIDVIYPMIIDLKQFITLREMFLQNTQDIPNAQLKHGIMFEVPSACLDAEEILSVAECASIGSNDLIQYLFAVDRNNDLVTHDYGPDRPAFWNLLKHLVKTAEKCNRPLSLCGEIGGQPEYIPKLMECGIRSVSVSPRMIGTARMTAKRVLGGSVYKPVE